MVNLIRTIVFFTVAAMIGLLLYWQVEIINLGGPVMVPLVMCSVFSLAITFERFVYFLRLHLGRDVDAFVDHLRQAIERHQWKEAQALCDAWKGPLARVISAGLGAREGTPQEIDEAMEEAAHNELPDVEQHLRWLATLAQVATLLGLLGTVTGLVQAFQVIQEKSSATGQPVNPGDLAGGVWEALITTVAGLTIAVPTILSFNYFSSRVDEVKFQMEKAAAIVAGWRRRRPAHPAAAS
jgi:biopolymer transport protein ExbB